MYTSDNEDNDDRCMGNVVRNARRSVGIATHWILKCVTMTSILCRTQVTDHCGNCIFESRKAGKDREMM